jgi:hypothetical protein
MKTPYKLAFSVLAFAVGILLAGIGIFEPPALTDFAASAGIPMPEYKYLAFAGAGLMGLGVWQFMPLLVNWRQTGPELTVWAEQSRGPALALGLGCMVVGVTIAGAMIWATSAVISSGTDGSVRTKPIALAVVVGGVLVWLGWLILRGAVSRSRVE